MATEDGLEVLSGRSGGKKRSVVIKRTETADLTSGHSGIGDIKDEPWKRVPIFITAGVVVTGALTVAVTAGVLLFKVINGPVDYGVYAVLGLCVVTSGVLLGAFLGKNARIAGTQLSKR